MVQTIELKDMGANVILLEYDNLEAFIMLSHVSSKRVRSIAKFLKIGRREIAFGKGYEGSAKDLVETKVTTLYKIIFIRS